MSYFAETDANGIVVRVIVAPDIQWPVDNLGGTWVETSDPYTDDGDPVSYCGPGFGHDATFPERFAPQWDQAAATTADDDGNFRYNTAGELVWHNGSMWRNLIVGVPNVWEPGVANWRNVPIDGSVPEWQQPTGAGDAYAIGTVVKYNGVRYESLIPANTTTPGSDDRWWELLDVPDVDPNAPSIEPWAPWPGSGPTYQIGDQVTHNGQTWEATVGNNVWEPGVFGWVVV